MPKINETIRNNPEMLAKYEARRKDVQARIADLGWGAQAKASRFTGVSQVYISAVLNGKTVSESTLRLLELWLEGDENADNS